MLVDFLIIMIYTALLSAFIVTVLRKQRFFNRFVSRAPYILNKVFTCDFCFCFWLSLLISIVACIVSYSLIWLLLPVFSAPVAKILL